MADKKVVRVNIPPAFPQFIRTTRVAAYARVSTSSLEQENSLEAQIDFYTKLVRTHPNWLLVNIYADEGISGVKYENRDEFNRMINDALDHKIDLILAKSISRFSRNTVDSLKHLRQLKAAGVGVYFEKEDINTLDAKGEFLITLMSCFAQEESRSISENVKWGHRKRMEDGKYSVPFSHFLGYDRGLDGSLTINPDEAKVVRLIYALSLYGLTSFRISTELAEFCISTVTGKKRWWESCIRSIITNEKYCGNALLQKKYVTDYLTKKEVKNKAYPRKEHNRPFQPVR